MAVVVTKAEPLDEPGATETERHPAETAGNALARLEIAVELAPKAEAIRPVWFD